MIVTSPPIQNTAGLGAEFHVNPTSLRLILAITDNPIRVFLHGSLFGSLGPSTSNATLTRQAVHHQVTFHFELVISLADYLSRPRKLKWEISVRRTNRRSSDAGRGRYRVGIDAASIEASTRDLAIPASSSKIPKLSLHIGDHRLFLRSAVE